MNGPNMSYCMVENTNRAVRQVMDALESVEGCKGALDLNRYEQEAWHELMANMQALAEMMAEADSEMAEVEIDSASGAYELDAVCSMPAPVLYALKEMCDDKLAASLRGWESCGYYEDLRETAAVEIERRLES